MRTLLTFLIGFFATAIAIAQTTAIPDPNFEQALIDLGLDSGVLDGQVPTSNIANITELDVSYSEIEDLTGIEDFGALTELNCFLNELTNLDVSQNTNLIELDCARNYLTNLDLTQNTDLTRLICWNNNLTSLNLSQNVSLTSLNCSGNDFADLDLSQNTALNFLTCGSGELTTLNITQCSSLLRAFVRWNNIAELDVSQNTVLQELYCSSNNLTELDISSNGYLERLECGSNQLVSLDISQNNDLTYLICSGNNLTEINGLNNGLETFYCSGNDLTELDISYLYDLGVLDCSYNNLVNLKVGSNNLSLSTLICSNNNLVGLDLSELPTAPGLSCSNNQLNCLNLRNGSANWTDSSLVATNNPDLTCIEVDDVAWADSTWIAPWRIDSIASFNSDCPNSCDWLPCTVSAGIGYTDNGNGNFSFENNSSGTFQFVDWNFGDGNTSSMENPSHTFDANGTYVVVLAIGDSTVTTGGNCTDYSTITLIVTGAPNPAPCNAGFSVLPNTITTDILIVNSSTGNNLTYLWDFGDGNTSTDAFPYHSYSGSGPYNLCLTIDDGAGCIDTFCDSVNSNGIVFKQESGFNINIISYATLGLDENIDEHANIEVYPNPTTDILLLRNLPADLREIKVFSPTGQLVRQISSNLNRLDVSSFSNGVYYIQFFSGEGSITRKFVKF